jgi:hypothetical protein
MANHPDLAASQRRWYPNSKEAFDQDVVAGAKKAARDYLTSEVGLDAASAR